MPSDFRGVLHRARQSTAHLLAEHTARFSIRRVALVALALASVATGITWRRTALHRGALRDWTATSSVILRLTAATARAWVVERHGDLELLTARAPRSPALFNISVPGRPRVTGAQRQQALANAIEQLRRVHGVQYTRIWIFDSRGRPLASSGGWRPMDQVRAVAKAALVTDSLLTSHIFTRPDGSRGVAFAQRVVYVGPDYPGVIPPGGVLGSIVLVVDPERTLFPALDGGSVRPGAEATALLTVQADSVQEYPLSDTGRHRAHVPYLHTVPPSLRAALALRADTAVSIPAGGVALLRPVPGGDWYVMRQAQPSAVFAAADARLAGECATVTVLVGLAVWLLLIRGRIADTRRLRELAVSERRYRLVTDNAMDVIARHRGDGHIDYVSPAVTWVLGRDPDEIVGLTLAELGHPADAAAVTALFGNVRRHAGTSRIEHRLRDVAGNDIWVETLARAVDETHRHEAVSHDAASAPSDIVTVTRDISTRKDAEAASRDALELVRAVVESSPVAIIAADTDARVLQWNPAAERLFGWTAAEIIGRPYPLAPGELWQEMERLRERTALHGHLSDLTVRRQRKDGTLADVSMSTGVIYDASGAPAGFVVLAIDLTDRVKLEEQLRQSQKMEAVGLLAGGVAHDFNNLLTVVTSYASLLLKELPDSDPVRDDLAEIHAAAKRGAALVGQLLAFSRQQVLAPRPVDVNALVAGMKQLLKRVLPSKITLQQVLAEESAVIEADPGQIEQVLLNLVVNARDAIGDAMGTITVTTAVETAPLRHHEMREAAPVLGEREVIITVRDTGCGIQSHLLEQIFDPFFTTKERGQGTGLGLSTVQGIVVQSGGRIRVRSDVGIGTEFELRFPVADRDPEVVTEELELGDANMSMDASTGVVLLVEDEPRVRRVTTRILEGAGYEVIAAADATEALSIFEQQAPRIDLIVTDMMMPDLTGAEMIARIRACGYDVPALFISGHTTPGPLAASAVDGSRFLQKPFAPDELTGKVRELIARRFATSSTWAVPTRGLLAR